MLQNTAMQLSEARLCITMKLLQLKVNVKAENCSFILFYDKTKYKCDVHNRTIHLSVLH
jgi:hypothetical protein